MNNLSLVDAHVHLWDLARLRYAWLDGVPGLNRSFLPADFAAASAGVSVRKIIFVEAGREAAQNIAEVDWVTELAKVEPRLRGIVAQVAIENAETVRKELGALSRRPLVKGVRRLLQGEKEVDFCLRSEFIAGVRLLAKFGFTFDLCIRHDQLRSVVELVRAVPEVYFVLDHFGKPGVRGGLREPWATEIQALAALPNVACKISGLTTEADWEKWRAEDLRFYFERTLECFGFDRVLFGSDWPVVNLAADYQRWVETVMGMAAGATEEERGKLFGGNAERLYGV
jgi:L-fuconolactonase